MKLNQDDIFQIITVLRLHLKDASGGVAAVRYPTIVEVCDSISNKLRIHVDEKLKQIVTYQLKVYKSKSSKKGDRNGDKISIVIDSDEFATTRYMPPPKRKKSLDEIESRKQILRRTQNIFGELVNYAAEEEIDVSRVLGLLLTRCPSKEVSDIGESLWKNQPSTANSKVPTNTTLALYYDCNLGRQTYTNLRKILAASEFNILSPWSHIRDKQAAMTPTVYKLPEPHVGVHFKLVDAIKTTACRIVEPLDDKHFALPLKLDIKFGFDGSGGHAIFNQSNQENTNNIIMTMFCPLKLGDSSGNVLWEQTSPNSPLTQRPLCLQMGKESSTTLRSLEIFNDDISNLRDHGYDIDADGMEFKLYANVKGYMMDKKAAHLYTGLGGCYCDLCSYSKLDCVNKEIIEEGFLITRNITDIHAIFNELVQENGEILKSKDDYPVREGVTTKPIANNDVISQQVLHALLRTFDHYMKIAVHIKAGIFDWSESKTSVNNQFLKHAKQETQTRIHNDIHGTKWDFPDTTGKGGTTTSGNTARDLLHKENRAIIVSELPDRYREIMLEYGQYLSIIIRVLSCKKHVDVLKFKQ